MIADDDIVFVAGPEQKRWLNIYCNDEIKIIDLETQYDCPSLGKLKKMYMGHSCNSELCKSEQSWDFPRENALLLWDGVQFRKLGDVETGKNYRATYFQPVNTTYEQIITCVLYGEFKIRLRRRYEHLINVEDLKKLNDSAEVYLTYGGMKLIENGKSAHMIEYSFGMLDRLHSIIMYIAFNPLDIRKYEDVTIGYHKVSFKPAGLGEQIELCNGMEHWILYNEEECMSLVPVPCSTISCAVNCLRPNTKLPASTTSFMAQANEEQLLQKWFQQSISYDALRSELPASGDDQNKGVEFQDINEHQVENRIHFCLQDLESDDIFSEANSSKSSNMILFFT
ncbi:hypothetical protein PR048_028951, partial [Dryococelus australis]